MSTVGESFKNLETAPGTLADMVCCRILIVIRNLDIFVVLRVHYRAAQTHWHITRNIHMHMSCITFVQVSFWEHQKPDPKCRYRHVGQFKGFISKNRTGKTMAGPKGDWS